MKKLFMIACCSLLVLSSRAALFITNNTACDVYIVLQAHDQNHGTCLMQSNRFLVAAFGSQAFNNVTSLNTSPGWQNGPAVTTGSGWDSALFGGVSIGGNLGPNCGGSTSITVPNGCGTTTVQADWYTIGGNTFIDFY
ncbi:hypothetical protein [Taibaiella helva]|uniref:hypothetical protein n=1 Tax=Taibaiella helva TaxID=2301235 RepID=UPI00130085D5|nr:hypothetical protein [Taibaiella helva]